MNTVGSLPGRWAHGTSGRRASAMSLSRLHVSSAPCPARSHPGTARGMVRGCSSASGVHLRRISSNFPPSQVPHRGGALLVRRRGPSVNTSTHSSRRRRLRAAANDDENTPRIPAEEKASPVPPDAPSSEAPSPTEQDLSEDSAGSTAASQRWKAASSKIRNAVRVRGISERIHGRREEIRMFSRDDSSSMDDDEYQVPHLRLR